MHPKEQNNTPKGEEESGEGKAEDAANRYAKSLVPKPNHSDAPFYTTMDRFQDLREAFKDGIEWAKQNIFS